MARPVRVACALIERERRVLVAKRPPGKDLAGMWEFPGGKADAGETMEECLVREIREELGCTIEIVDALTPVLHEPDDTAGSIDLIPFRCRLLHGEPSPLEHSAIEWVSGEKLEKMDLAPADRPVLEEYLRIG